MSNTSASRKLLAIPGPIECTDEVMRAIAQPTKSHMDPSFVATFKEAIQMTRKVLYTTSALPFILAGSGTLGWDQVACNLIEQGEAVLVLSTGYFGDGFADCLQAYGAIVDVLRAPAAGEVVAASSLEEAIRKRKYKAVVVTHVDTSTGVLSDIKTFSSIVRRVSPDTLVVLDGVCSVASEDIKFDEWDLDIVVSASQKGLGAPPGLSILVASQRAIKTFENRKAPVAAYYCSWQRWIPIMRAYDAGKAAYFATPAVNMIYALHASLKQITATEDTMRARLLAHRRAGERIRAVARQLGYQEVPKEGSAANGMTALYVPTGFAPSDVMPRFAESGVVIAGGIHKDIKDKYIRIGHMGTTVVNKERGDIEKIETALKASVAAKQDLVATEEV